MTYTVGDDATQTYPVTDTAGGALAIPATVTAHNSAGDEHDIAATWQGPAGPHPTIQGATTRLIDVPLQALPAGLWGLQLTIDNAADLFLGNVFIQ